LIKLKRNKQRKTVITLQSNLKLNMKTVTNVII